MPQTVQHKESMMTEFKMSISIFIIFFFNLDIAMKYKMIYVQKIFRRGHKFFFKIY